MSNYPGIDYTGPGSSVNRDPDTHIRYGVINQRTVGQAWYDDSQPYYGKPGDFKCPDCKKDFSPNGAMWGETVECPHCKESIELEIPDCCDPLSHYFEDEAYLAECGENGEIFINRSPYYTYAQFCSPCVPGAGNLDRCPEFTSVLNEDGRNSMLMIDGKWVSGFPKVLCFGHDWFEGGKAPYFVFSVETNELVNPKVD